MNNTTAADLAINLIQRILGEITFHPLKIWMEPMGRTQIIYVQTTRADMPRVIGKAGAHRNALFNLIEYVGMRYSTELRVENVEPEAGPVERFAPFKPASTWDSQPIIQLMRDLCSSVFLFETQVTIQDSKHTPTSTLQVIVSNEENMQRTARIADALKVLFNAIGKRHGRILLVDVLAQSEFTRLNAAVK